MIPVDGPIAGGLGAWLVLAAGLAGACGCSDGSSRNDAARHDATAVPGRRATTDTLAGSAEARRRAIEANQARIAANRPPTARLEVSPREGWAGLTMLHLDSGDCSDDFTHPGAMLKRYDFDGDGTWDTGFQRGVRVGHVLDRAGEFRPRVLVKDTGGLTDSAASGSVILHPPCPPPDFALLDVNPNSPTRGQTLRLADQRGRPVLAWVVTLST